MGEVLTEDQHMVFVGGLHRSGTTLLAHLLASHPDAAGLTGTGAWEDEGQHVQDVYAPAERHGGTGRFALNPKSHLTDDDPAATSENAQRLWDCWRPYWDSDARFLVEKSPPNLLMGRFLQALYPQASFVFIVRHPVTVTLANRKWRKRTPLHRLMENWFRAHEVAAQDLPHLERVSIVSYERLISEPEAVVADVARFLEMPGTIDTSSVDSGGSSRYEEEWTSMLTSGHRGATKAYRQFRERARDFGYDLDALSVVPRYPLVDPPVTPSADR